MYVCVGCHESQAWACYCPLVTWKFRNSRSTNHETSLCLWGSVAGGKKRDWKVLRRAAVAYTWDAHTHTHTNTYTHTHTRGYIHRRIVVDGRLLGAFITSWGPLLPLVTGGCLSMLGAICYYLSPGSWGILVVDWRTSNS